MIRKCERKSIYQISSFVEFTVVQKEKANVLKLSLGTIKGLILKGRMDLVTFQR